MNRREFVTAGALLPFGGAVAGLTITNAEEYFKHESRDIKGLFTREEADRLPKYTLKQKFRKLTCVKVAEKMPPHMSHFDCGFVGIVDGTYSQIYGGSDVKSYSIYKVVGFKIVNHISWYNEDQLTELSYQDREKSEGMIERYHLGKFIPANTEQKWWKFEYQLSKPIEY